MNWYEKFIKEASPLPELQQGEYPIRNREGLTSVKDLLQQEEADRISKVRDLSFLGSGFFGAAWSTGDKAIKITSDFREIKIAQTILNKQRVLGISCLPFVVKVYSVKKLANLTKIITEKVAPLDESQQGEFWNNYERIYFYNYEPKENDDNFIKAIKIFNDSLKAYGARDVDIHQRNVGWRGNNLVVLDLGAIDFQ